MSQGTEQPHSDREPLAPHHAGADPELPAKKAKNPPPTDIGSFADALDYADPRPPVDGDPGFKRTYGTRLSNATALLVADRLRPDFPGILPTQDGKGTESRARIGRGFKKLDVNYSTLQTGLGLGISIKTINFRDPGTKRYTKNYSRNDNELRAEASDYHERQPYAVLCGLVFLPADASTDVGTGKGEDAKAGVSSFGACVKYFRNRAGRIEVSDPIERFERFFVCLYGLDGTERGYVRCFDVMKSPPRDRPPTNDESSSLEEVVLEIRETYDRRNTGDPFEWAE
jgi:hypothetical protein